MRKALLSVAMAILALTTVVTQKATLLAQKQDCDGTSPKSVKCNFTEIPKGYFESQTCFAGKLQAGTTCLNAVAYNQDDFSCTTPTVRPGTNEYLDLCLDDTSTAPIQCTVIRICTEQTYYPPDGPAYQGCAQGDPAITYKYKKSNFECNSVSDSPERGITDCNRLRVSNM